jgi:hypothetical protein
MVSNLFQTIFFFSKLLTVLWCTLSVSEIVNLKNNLQFQAQQKKKKFIPFATIHCQQIQKPFNPHWLPGFECYLIRIEYWQPKGGRLAQLDDSPPMVLQVRGLNYDAYQHNIYFVCLLRLAKHTSVSFDQWSKKDTIDTLYTQHIKVT